MQCGGTHNSRMLNLMVYTCTLTAGLEMVNYGRIIVICELQRNSKEPL
jgi:hypothetical protein